MLSFRITPLTAALKIVIVALIFCGITTLAAGKLFCVVFLLPAIASVSVFQGVDIDVQGNRIKLFTSLFWFKIGRWKQLPPCKSVWIRKMNETYTSRRGRVTKKTVFRVFLMTTERGNNFLVYIGSEKAETIEQGQKLATALQLPVKSDIP